MANEGYAAVTSRRVAEQAGLNRALVHYYFHAMDDLFIALTMEFVALANHRKAIAAEIVETVERFREQEHAVLTEAFTRYGVPPGDMSPAVASALLESVTRFLAAETTLGMSEGHAETVAFVERLIRRLEGDRHP